VVTQLEMTNNSDEDLEFEVIMKGPDITGSDTFLIPARGSSMYQIMFRPLSIYQERARLAFINKVVGEKVFYLKLNSENPSVKLPLIRA
jgi:hypothetical protein